MATIVSRLVHLHIGHTGSSRQPGTHDAADDEPLRSGRAWGEQYLEDGVGVIAPTVGEGNLVRYGPEVTNRTQSHGTHGHTGLQRRLLRRRGAVTDVLRVTCMEEHTDGHFVGRLFTEGDEPRGIGVLIRALGRIVESRLHVYHGALG